MVRDEEGRSRITVNVRDMRWAGNWPGASMIYLEYQLAWADREMTDEERQGGIRYFTLAAERGYGRPELLRGEFDLARDRFYDSALDGAIRRRHLEALLPHLLPLRRDRIITVEQPRYLCPDDPNPHFPDSPIYDKNIYSPKNPRYYSDPREKAPNTPYHDGGTPALQHHICRSAALVTAEQIRRRRNARTVLWSLLGALAISALAFFLYHSLASAGHCAVWDPYSGTCSVLATHTTTTIRPRPTYAPTTSPMPATLPPTTRPPTTDIF